MKRFRDESGQTLVFTALAMAILLGFTALAMDVSMMWRAKRRLQIAADAAATAAALDWYYTSSTASAYTMGRAASSSNNVTNGDTNGDTVQVTCAPTVGPHTAAGASGTNCNGYFEAIVTQPNNTIFGVIAGQSRINVQVRAVAAPTPATSCFYLEKTTGNDFSAQGAAKIMKPGGGNTCGVYVNSTDPSSVSITGQGNQINVAYVQSAGGLSANGNSTILDTAGNPVPLDLNSPIQTYPSAYSNMTGPNPASLTCNAPTGGTVKIKGTNYTYLTNTDVSAMPTGGSGTLCFSGRVMIDGNGSTLSMPAGLYVFSGPDIIIGNSVTAPTGWNSTTTSGQNGVTFDVYSGTLSVTSTTSITLHAPTQGTYNSVLLLAPGPYTNDVAPANCNTSSWNIQWGSASGVFDGMIVAPCVAITLQDQGGSALVTGLITGSLALQAGTLNVTKYGSVHPTSPLQSITLVE